MNTKHNQVARWLSVALWAALAQVNWAQAQVIANSTNEFSGVQGQDGWFYGYRNVTADGKGIDYDANADFIPFDASMWTGTGWDLDSAGAAPWTALDQEFVHPNGVNNAEEHWAIRRWVASELSGPTWISVVWNVRKENLSGDGVTGALHVNGARVQSAPIAGNNGTGVTQTYFVRPNPADQLDLILSPIGPTGDTGDGADGSYTWMQIELLADSDSDSLPDAWEYLYFPGDLTKLSGSGDFDTDGLTDGAEMLRSTDPTKADTDADGLGDAAETDTGVYVSPTNTGTDPLTADTDSDGRQDGAEVNGTPTTDPFDPDSDDDTYLDGDEVTTGHDPNNTADNPETTAIANSMTEFTEFQGQDGWSWGYRNYTLDGGGDNYNPDPGFIPFDAGMWTGTGWDLDSGGAAPWTELFQEATHPNGAGNGDTHWTVRRWVAAEITQVTPLALRWHVRKQNTGCGNGVTGGLYINGQLRDRATIAGGDGVGVTHTYYANVTPGDKIDMILSPRGADNSDADGCDSSATRLLVDPTIPAVARQPDGSIFIPVGAGDTDADGLPDVWEQQYFPSDLTRLTSTGDHDQDGLSDTGEYQRDSDPTKPDTDGDGLTDLVETRTGTWVSTSDTGSDPKKPDTDGDGLTDGQEAQRVPPTNPNRADTDADGFTDPEEIAAGTDPTNPNDNPVTFVIANSQAEFSGTQGRDGWFNGYRVYDPVAGTVNYNPNQDFIPYPGGDGLGDWDGFSQTWTGSAWDLNTAGAAPWTYQAALEIHPNGANSEPVIGGVPEPNNEHWPIRRWAAQELTQATPVTIIWRVRKTNLNPDGVTGLLFINGILADSKAIAGTDGTNEVRRYRTTLQSNDIVDLALSPEGLNGAREDWSDGSETWFWVDTRPWPVDVNLSGVTVNLGQGVCTFRWNSQPGARYTVHQSANLTDWAPIRSVDGTGTETSFTDDLGSPVPAVRFYRVSQP